jgi:hypothetical protein
LLLLKAIDNLRLIGEWTAEFNRKVFIIDSVCNGLDAFFEIALSYNLKQTAKKIISILSLLMKLCSRKDPQNKRKFISAVQRISFSLKTMNNNIQLRRPAWRTLR